MNFQHSYPGPQVLLELRSLDNFHSSLPFELLRIGLVVHNNAQILQNRTSQQNRAVAQAALDGNEWTGEGNGAISSVDKVNLQMVHAVCGN